jgi:hypothetical protein
MSTKELQEKLVETLKEWQEIEDASVASTAGIIEKTNVPLIQQVMEIIHKDSQTHKAVQGFIISSIQDGVVFSTDDLVDIWDAIEAHLALERQMMGHVEAALAELQGKHMIIAEYLLHYLAEDEKKHANLLGALESLKRGMYPYA